MTTQFRSKHTTEDIISMLEGAIDSLYCAKGFIEQGRREAAHREAQDAKEQIITAMMEMEEL